jgi:hypothetical protein
MDLANYISTSDSSIPWACIDGRDYCMTLKVFKIPKSSYICEDKNGKRVVINKSFDLIDIKEEIDFVEHCQPQDIEVLPHLPDFPFLIVIGDLEVKDYKKKMDIEIGEYLTIYQPRFITDPVKALTFKDLLIAHLDIELRKDVVLKEEELIEEEDEKELLEEEEENENITKKDRLSNKIQGDYTITNRDEEMSLIIFKKRLGYITREIKIKLFAYMTSLSGLFVLRILRYIVRNDNIGYAEIADRTDDKGTYTEKRFGLEKVHLIKNFEKYRTHIKMNLNDWGKHGEVISSKVDFEFYQKKIEEEEEMYKNDELL